MASTSTRAESSTSSSCLPPQYYDVFLSFRGEDTRRNFTDHLYSALVRHGFSTFRDDDELKTGEEIGPELLNSIERSTISVIVFSKNYAGSRWCLDELVKILECKRTFQRMVLPVFYHVDPSDIRAQKGSFAEAFAKHEKRYEGRGMEGKLEEWRAALTQASNLSGWDLQNVADGHESKFIEKIVEDISNKLNLPYLSVADYPVGIESRVQHINILLSLASDDVRMVGIWGIGGLGKTTIAKAIYNKIRHRFEGSSFLANVREREKHPNGFVGLQEQLLSDILNENRNIRYVDRGIEVIKKRVWCRRVLVVLDDVDDNSQLKALAIKRDCFRSGSRIIVTTRDQSLLKILEVDGEYTPELLNDSESIQLFNWNAFREDYPIKDFVELSKEVVHYAGGLPLALEVLGSYFKGREMPEWKSALESLKVIPHHDIQSTLRISFDSLNGAEKALFLDIACFFVGMHLDYTILEDQGFFPIHVLGVLSRRCLIKIKSGSLTMHDMLRDMGRDIVRREHDEPGKRSRLWFHEDLLDVLENYTGTDVVEILIINLRSSVDVKVNAQALAKMNKLRLLELNYVNLSGSCEHLPKTLRWLRWFGFPLKSIPSKLFLEQVVVIDMRYSSLKQVWKGRKILNKLKILDLSHSYCLTETPDFSGCTSLEKLFLNDCIRLVEIHKSIKCLDKLLVLDLRNCKSLRKLSCGIWKLTSLQRLSLYNCSMLGKLPGSEGSPSKSLLSIISSQALRMRNPDSINHSLSSIQRLISLKTLDMENCNLSYIPGELGSLISLESLSLEGNNFRTLPTSISHLSRLRFLRLARCPMLQSLPELPINVELVNARDCTSLERISIGSNFQKPRGLHFTHCPKLVENNTTSDFVTRLFLNQELSALGEFGITLPGCGVPDCFNWQSVGPVLDRKIRGWVVCLVSAQNEETFINYVPQCYPYIQMEAGDRDVVEYVVQSVYDTFGSHEKWGVILIYEDDEKDYPSNDQATIQVASPMSFTQKTLTINSQDE